MEKELNERITNLLLKQKDKEEKEKNLKRMRKNLELAIEEKKRMAFTEDQIIQEHNDELKKILKGEQLRQYKAKEELALLKKDVEFEEYKLTKVKENCERNLQEKSNDRENEQQRVTMERQDMEEMIKENDKKV